ncbi:hypothetical protein H6F47_03410 [Sphaerospermopsis sp. FACHB-1094]|uniref:hypothetical protein n=1 Tax=Sphaerospermopsis sp. FACHB-1094 TaxID=2692861 RepID=UPI0016833DFC|nr:hypothetical protein [Sphaerospermopsis sp. FACHB-1094]MBD2131528.1 hypothetical protein [Sphaerospermopsis sp. FACHB-1094]
MIGNHKIDYPITNHQSPITNHQSPITNHQSPVPSPQSPVTNYQFLLINLPSIFGKFFIENFLRT